MENKLLLGSRMLHKANFILTFLSGIAESRLPWHCYFISLIARWVVLVRCNWKIPLVKILRTVPWLAYWNILTIRLIFLQNFLKHLYSIFSMLKILSLYLRVCLKIIEIPTNKIYFVVLGSYPMPFSINCWTNSN